MSGLLPTDTEPSDREGGELRVLWLDDDESERLISSLSSDTARSVLTTVHDDPSTASELSEEVGTSVQNIRHHLSNLEEAGLVTVVDTRYSVKGREMSVYGPTDDSLVVCVGREDDRSTFLDSLKRLVGTVAILGVLSLVLQFAFGTAVRTIGGPATSPRFPNSVGGDPGPLLGLLPPGIAFLAGGMVVLALVAIWEYRRE